MEMMDTVNNEDEEDGTVEDNGDVKGYEKRRRVETRMRWRGQRGMIWRDDGEKVLRAR